MIVVDASVLANAFTDNGPVGRSARAELARDVHWAGPDHLVVETFSAIRGRWLGQKISEQRARDALASIATTTIELVAVEPHLERMWELRNNVSGYDAAYFAVAETFQCALVTADARLGHVRDVQCDVRVALPSR
ncbi:type II toxin-antitoxin system VapC family toxin [Pseudactinotalea sp. Z1748]|uniref:type II toxin-antitoxin system VapC family toxin n=1 Tax=Pseudactinotalea sp. Z1748 TaxID=3413027 RepID=UPI003C7EBC61